MASTPPLVRSNGSSSDDNLGESWVDLSDRVSLSDRITPPLIGVHGSEEYIRLLREAQRESNQSSARVSVASSRRHSPHETPKSPPSTPNTEPSTDSEDLAKGYFINREVEKASASDWVWDWSSRPDLQPPKEWKFQHPPRKLYCIRHAKVGKKSLFSREVLYTLFFTNILSLLLGTGIGLWLSRKNNPSMRVPAFLID